MSGGGFQRFKEVKAGRTEWSLRCQRRTESDAPLFLIWVSGCCGDNAETGTVGRSRSDGKIEFSFDHIQGQEAVGHPEGRSCRSLRGKVQEVGQPVQPSTVCPARRTSETLR